MARDPRTDKWSPAAFVSANQASIGFQVGSEQNFVVILLMDTNALRFLTEPNFRFAAEAAGTAGNADAGAGSSVDVPQRAVLVYGDRQGYFGGAAIGGGQ